MDQFAARIETYEHTLMRAWMQGDRKALKALADRDFIFLLGSTRAAILDRPSWLDAATTRFRCQSYRFGEVYVRRHGKAAFFSCQMTLDAKIDDIELASSVWVTDLWRRSGFRRKWRIVERVFTLPDPNENASAAIRSMQLWR
jgi:hypothetical protein